LHRADERITASAGSRLSCSVRMLNSLTKLASSGLRTNVRPDFEHFAGSMRDIPQLRPLGDYRIP
jgi:hypothetical protein